MTTKYFNWSCIWPMIQHYVFHTLFFIPWTAFFIVNVITVSAPYQELMLWERMGRNFWIHNLAVNKKFNEEKFKVSWGVRQWAVPESGGEITFPCSFQILKILAHVHLHSISLGWHILQDEPHQRRHPLLAVLWRREWTAHRLDCLRSLSKLSFPSLSIFRLY